MQRTSQRKREKSFIILDQAKIFLDTILKAQSIQKLRNWTS